MELWAFHSNYHWHKHLWVPSHSIIYFYVSKDGKQSVVLLKHGCVAIFSIISSNEFFKWFLIFHPILYSEVLQTHTEALISPKLTFALYTTPNDISKYDNREMKIVLWVEDNPRAQFVHSVSQMLWFRIGHGNETVIED